MKKINLITIIFALMLSLSMLASCSLGEDGGAPTPPSDQEPPVSDGDSLGWSRGDKIYYRGDSDISMKPISSGFASLGEVDFFESGGGENDKFFILGEQDSALSEYAYSSMNKAYKDQSFNSIFTICTDGRSVAIAYSDRVARYAAIECFFSEFESFDLTKKSVLATKEFETQSSLTEERAALLEESFAAIEQVFSAAAVTELKKLYSLYDERTYIWLVNLYDADIGGFYYSSSGRNTQGFLPDLESTAQALMFMSESGMLVDYGGKYKDALPEEMKAAILEFAKACQDSTDGYFYHPQWGKDISGTRLGRDLGWATRIISGLGSTPLWNTPNGVTGSLGAPGSQAQLTASLKRGVCAAVSAVRATATPDHLTDVELFKKYLAETYDWENDSYRAGNAIESELGQIQNAGIDYTDALIEFLSSKQKSNGLWEEDVSYDSVNGLMKISGVYTSLGEIIPNAQAAMQSAISMLKSDAKASHVCSVYNPWEAVANILESLEKTLNTEEVGALRAQFREEAEELIKTTLEKLSVFKKPDGAFSYYIKYSAANSQGSPVALDKSEEGDVNATMICTNSIIRAMFSVFGVTAPARYYAVDYAMFTDELYGLGTIIKDPVEAAEEMTFDDYDLAWGQGSDGVNTEPDPDGFAINIVGDKDLNSSGQYKWFESKIVKNPAAGASKSDQVLYAKSNVYTGAEKPLADKPSSTRFLMPNAGLSILGDCYVYDAEMYFVPGYGRTNYNGNTTSDPMLQLFFMTESLPCASLNFSVYTENGVDYVKIGENYAGLDGKESNIAGNIPMGEWVHIRIEYYKNYETADDGNGGTAKVYKPAMKIFVNGKFEGDCDATITGADSKGVIGYYDRKVDQVSISYYRYLASEIYFNNVLVERCKKDYVAEITPDAIVEPPLPDEDMRESYGFEDGLLNTSNVANKIRVNYFGTSKYINASEGQTYNTTISYSLTKDPKNEANNVLKVVTKASTEFDKPSRTEVNLHNSSAQGSDYVFSGKFYYPSSEIGKNGDLTQIFFFNSLDGQLYSLRVSAKASNGVFALSLIENNSSSESVLAEDIPCDEWFSLKIVMHKTGVADTTGADVYLNGALIAKDKTYMSAALEQSPVMKVCLVHQRTNNSTLYLDDLSFTKDGEVVGAVESEERVMGFENGFNSKYVHSYSYSGQTKLDVAEIAPTVMESLYTKYYLYTDPKNEASKVLRAVNKSGGTNAGYTEVKISNESPVGSCYTFNSRMYIETCTNGYNVTQINFVDKNSDAALSLYLSVDKDTGKLKITTTGSGAHPASGTNLLADTAVSVAKKQWFDLRVEFYNKGAGATTSNTYVKLYVNDTLAYSGVGYLKLGAEVDHVDIIHCKTAKSSAVYFDDISLSRTEKEYSKD